MFTSGMREATEQHVHIESASLHSFRPLLCYLYSAKVDMINEKNVIELLMLSNLYQVQQLQVFSFPFSFFSFPFASLSLHLSVSLSLSLSLFCFPFSFPFSFSFLFPFLFPFLFSLSLSLSLSPFPFPLSFSFCKTAHTTALQSYCEGYVETGIQTDNVAYLLQLAHQYNTQHLRSVALNYLLRWRETSSSSSSSSLGEGDLQLSQLEGFQMLRCCVCVSVSVCVCD